LCPSTPLWTPPNFTVTTFIEGYSCFDPDRSNTAAKFLRSLPTTDVVVWTDGSAPLLWVPKVQISILSAEDVHLSALVNGLEWCHSHLKSCHFQSALFLTNSQSALTLLSSAPAFFQRKSFWYIWDLSDSISSV